MSEGKYKKTAEGYRISYDESEVTGFEGSTTMLELVGGKKVLMNRVGAVESELVIELGTKHHCMYGTPYGEFMIGVTAKSIESTLGEAGGKLDFIYILDLNSSYLGEFEINVTVKENNTEKGMQN